MRASIGLKAEPFVEIEVLFLAVPATHCALYIARDTQYTQRTPRFCLTSSL